MVGEELSVMVMAREGVDLVEGGGSMEAAAARVARVGWVGQVD